MDGSFGMVSEQDVLQSLAAYGAPLASTEPAATLALEEALVEGLKLSHRKAVVFRTLPIVLLKHRNRLDWGLVRTKGGRRGRDPRPGSDRRSDGDRRRPA